MGGWISQHKIGLAHITLKYINKTRVYICYKMGSILSRRIAGVEDIDIQANSAYRYPPKSGKYIQ